MSKRRYIRIVGINARIIEAIFAHSNPKNTPGAFICLHIETVFDRLD